MTCTRRLISRLSLTVILSSAFTLTGVVAQPALAAPAGHSAATTATTASAVRGHEGLRRRDRLGHGPWYGGGRGSAGPVEEPAIPVGGGPQDLAADPATHTAYVPNGNDGTVSVINTAVCNGVTLSGCDQPVPVISLADPGGFPSAVALDAATGTLYVADANDNNVSVINVATCNALTTNGCGQTPAVMATGVAPFNIALDPATHTLYTANFADGTVSVLDASRCNARVVTGCGQTAATISYGTAQPDGLQLDPASHTLYVANLALTSTDPSEVDTIALVDTSRCNAHATAGCSPAGPSVVVGTASTDYNVGLALDDRTRTLYVTNPADNTISLVDLRQCTAGDSLGCGQISPTAPTAAGSAIGLTLLQQSDSLYVTLGSNSTVSVLSVVTCNAQRTTGCATPAATIRGGIGLNATRYDPGTATLYLVQAADISAVSTKSCNSTITRGCLSPAPTVHVGSVPNGVAVNPATHTAYVANAGDSTVSVIDTRTCAAPYTASCPGALPTIHGVDSAHNIAVDVVTDTLYVTDNGSEDIISVIDGATCNASNTSGCGQTPATVAVGQVSYGIVDDSAIHTVYVANSSSNTVSVVDTRHCRSGDTTGCGQPPATVDVGVEPLGIALNEATHTVYVADIQQAELTLIDTRTCQAADTSGCGATMPTAAAGLAPRSVAVDPANGTVYVADAATNQVAVIDADTCRASDRSGCSQTPAVVNVGADPVAIAVSPDGRTVYAANLLDNTLSVIDADACNSHHLAPACSHQAPVLAVGDGPNGLAFDPYTRTVYVTNGFGYGYDDSVSVLRAA